MNATAQRTHRTVTQSLDSRVAVLETLVAQLSQNSEWLKRQGDGHRGTILNYGERLDAVESLEELGRLNAAPIIQFHHYSSFLARFRWLLLGR